MICKACNGEGGHWTMDYMGREDYAGDCDVCGGLGHVVTPDHRAAIQLELGVVGDHRTIVYRSINDVGMDAEFKRTMSGVVTRVSNDTVSIQRRYDTVASFDYEEIREVW